MRRAFTPSRIEARRNRIKAITQEVLSAVDERGTPSQVDELAGPMPLRVVCEMPRLGQEDSADIGVWSEEVGVGLGTNLADLDEAFEPLQGPQRLVRRPMDERSRTAVPRRG